MVLCASSDILGISTSDIFQLRIFDNFQTKTVRMGTATQIPLFSKPPMCDKRKEQAEMPVSDLLVSSF